MKFTVNLGQIPCIRASIFTLGGAQQGREGRTYKLGGSTMEGFYCNLLAPLVENRALVTGQFSH